MKARRFSKKQGALFIEVLLSISVLSLGAAAFFSLYPVMTRSERLAREESIAGQLTTRYIEHLQLLRPSEVSYSNLHGLSLVDDEPTNLPYSFTNVPLDQASGYSPSRLLRNGTGSVQITDIAGGSKLITITLQWDSASGVHRSFVTGTVLGAFR